MDRWKIKGSASTSFNYFCHVKKVSLPSNWQCDAVVDEKLVKIFIFFYGIIKGELLHFCTGFVVS